MDQPILDRPEVRRALFHPRQELGFRPLPPGARQVSWPLEPDLSLGGRLYPAGVEAPAILFFHGNGEIAADYDAIAPLYGRLGISLLVADYRGYGRSGGAPTAGRLLSDAVAVFAGLGALWEEQGLAPARVFAMGRSLGSAAAIEVALHAGDRLAGLIVESGLADTFALLARMGVPLAGADEARDGFGNAGKMARIGTPTLVIHGGADVLIPPADGRALYRRSAAADKRFVLIPGGGHNDLMMVGHQAYFDAIQAFVWGEVG
jgi:pimeloyl-ACP methyl ester carboxylesterase